MKAISIRQPWAAAILAGVKTIEVRSWKPQVETLPLRVLVHAGSVGSDPGHLPESVYWDLHFGAIVGAVTIDSVIRYGDSYDRYCDDMEDHYCLCSWWRPGLYGWKLTNPVKCDPVPLKGRLGFFETGLDEGEVLK